MDLRTQRTSLGKFVVSWEKTREHNTNMQPIEIQTTFREKEATKAFMIQRQRIGLKIVKNDPNYFVQTI